MKAYLIVLAGCLITNCAYSMEKNKKMAFLVLGDTKEYSVEKIFVNPLIAAYIPTLEYYRHSNQANQGYKNVIKSKYFRRALFYCELIAKFANLFE